MYDITPNRKAILNTINWAEGSPGYDELYTYEKFDNNGPHPNKTVCSGGLCSTAAGAYQFLYSTWITAIDELGIDDYMSGTNQDQAALQRVADRGALADIDSGDIAAAIPKLANEWASFPGNTYGQGGKTVDEITAHFNDSVFYQSNKTIIWLVIAALALILIVGTWILIKVWRGL